MLGTAPCNPQPANNICTSVQMQTLHNKQTHTSTQLSSPQPNSSSSASQRHPPTTFHSNHSRHGLTMSANFFVNNGSKLKTLSLEPRPPSSSLHSSNTPCHANAGSTTTTKSCSSPSSSNQTPANSGRKHAPLSLFYQPSSRLLLHGSPTSPTSQLQHHIQPPTCPPPHQPQPPPAHPLNHPFTTEEVRRGLRHLHNGRSGALQGYTSEVLRYSQATPTADNPAPPHLLIPCLQKLFNLAFSTGQVPTEWQTSLVTPIFKRGNTDDTSNYRPIAVVNLSSGSTQAF